VSFIPVLADAMARQLDHHPFDGEGEPWGAGTSRSHSPAAIALPHSPVNDREKGDIDVGEESSR
jgi:hypothetical protein